MDGKSVVLMAAMMTLAGVAGCLETPAFLRGSQDEVSAQSVRDLAHEAALAWDAGAVLVGVGAVESTEEHPELAADPAVGNGLAVVWNFAYLSADRASARAFQVSAAGEVKAHDDADVPADAPQEELRRISAWSIDSDAAAQAAAANATFASVLQTPNATLAMGLVEEATTMWFVVAGTPSGLAIARVDATTGELDSVETMATPTFSMPPMPMHWGSFEPPAQPVHLEGAGKLDAGKRSEEYAFEAFEGQQALLKVTYKSALPTDSLRVKLIGPDDEVVDIHTMYHGRSLHDDSQLTAAFELEETGAYKLILMYGGAPVAGSVKYEMVFDAAHDLEEEEEEA